jgi:hypothetical protein
MTRSDRRSDPGVSNMTTHRDIAVVLRSGTQSIAPGSTIHGKYTGSNQKREAPAGWWIFAAMAPGTISSSRISLKSKQA